MFPYVPYLYPLMLLLCKQMIVFPLPSVSGEKDTALRSFSVLLINGVCRQLGWSLSYIVSITIIPRYFPLTFVLYLLSPPLILISSGFSFQLLSLMKLQELAEVHKRHDPTLLVYPPFFLVTASYQCMLLQEGSGQHLEDKPRASYGHRQMCVHVSVWVGEGPDTAFEGEYKDSFLRIRLWSWCASALCAGSVWRSSGLRKQKSLSLLVVHKAITSTILLVCCKAFLAEIHFFAKQAQIKHPRYLFAFSV